MSNEEKGEHPLSKNPNAPMWKTFMITDLGKVERTSGEIHAKLGQPQQSPAEALGEMQAQRDEGKGKKTNGEQPGKKSDVYPDALPEHMREGKEPEQKGSEPPDIFAGREVILRPVIADALLPLPPTPQFRVLPSRDEDIKVEFKKAGFGMGEAGITLSKTRLPGKKG